MLVDRSLEIYSLPIEKKNDKANNEFQAHTSKITLEPKKLTCSMTCSGNIHDQTLNSGFAVPSPRRFISSSFPVNLKRNLYDKLTILDLH